MVVLTPKSSLLPMIKKRENSRIIEIVKKSLVTKDASALFFAISTTFKAFSIR